jgi:hypothetical protein
MTSRRSSYYALDTFSHVSFTPKAEGVGVNLSTGSIGRAIETSPFQTPNHMMPSV